MRLQDHPSRRRTRIEVEATNMTTRILISTIALGLAAVSGNALADNGRHKGHDRDRDGDYARVVRVEPLMERVRYTVPVEQCWTEERVRSNRSSDAGAALVGGAIGAIFGHAIGDGRGRTAATLGGAVIGAAVGNELSKSDSRRDRGRRYEQVERCRTSYEERFDERVVSYRVTYEYNGRRQVTQMPYDPGRYLRVAVDVHPLG
jgi:uncharacterized protein YcfJ